MLLNLRNGTIAQLYYQQLMTRMITLLTETDVQLFHAAPNPAADHKAEYDINMDFINILVQLICLIIPNYPSVTIWSDND